MSHENSKQKTRCAQFFFERGGGAIITFLKPVTGQVRIEGLR
jgi:hypothetical protein